MTQHIQESMPNRDLQPSEASKNQAQVSLSRICELKTHNSDFYNQHGRSNCTGPPLQNTRQIWKDKSNKHAARIVPLTSLPLLFANRWVNDGNWLQSATPLKARKNLYPQTPFSLVTENGHSLRMWSERSNKKSASITSVLFILQLGCHVHMTSERWHKTHHTWCLLVNGGLLLIPTV